MKTRWIWLLVALLVAGCSVAQKTEDWTALVATEAALVTLEPVALPAPVPEPEDRGAVEPLLPEPPVVPPVPSLPSAGVSACPGGVCPVGPSPAYSYPPSPAYVPSSRPRLFGRFRR